MIIDCTGSILDSRTSALVNPVNCEGIAGKGLALAFRKCFPESYDRYRFACDEGHVAPGRVFHDEYAHIFYFPTKRTWREGSRIEDIESGLSSLESALARSAYASVAIPALGCGLGGLEWSTVKPLIEKKLSSLSEMRIELYAPWSKR